MIREARDPVDIEQGVLSTVRGLVEELGSLRALDAVRPDASLEKDLGLGSLERVELLSRLEAMFSVELAESTLAEAETPADLVAAVLAGETRPGWRKIRAAVTEPAIAAELPEPDTLVDTLRARAEADPLRPHVYLQEDGGEERVIRYGDLYRDALNLAGGLSAQGVRPGDTVALLLPTSTGFFTAFAGVLLAGGVPVPLYPPFRMDRVEEYARRQASILRNAGTSVLITVGKGRSFGHLVRSEVPDLRLVTTVDELASAAAPAPSVSGGPDSPALIQYTSGSTGDPKGVLLTHRNLIANIRAIGLAMNIQATDVGASWLPLYHDMGLIGCWLTPLYFAVPVVILSPLTFLSRPERWLWAIHVHRATISAAPNFAYELCVRKIPDEALEGLDLACWRGALNGAEPVSPETLERFARRFSPFGFRAEAMMPVFGLAESSVAVAVPPLGRGPRVESVARRTFEESGRAVPVANGQVLKFVSCGRALAEHEIRIVDDEGMEIPERVEGTIQFRGPSTMQGYYRNPEATQAVLRPGGWVDTGDRGFLADGELFVTGRSKDIIIRAGRNIYPQEVEEIVAGVEGARRGCVVAFGVQDARQGTEKLVVVAETRLEEKRERHEMVQAVQDRLTEHLGAPAEEIHLVPPRTVPKTSSGKLRRSATRERYLHGDLVSAESGRLWWLLRVGLAQIRILAGRVLSLTRRCLYGAYVIALSLVSIVPFWLLALLVPSPRIVSRTVRWATRVYILMSGCRLRVRGLENLQPLQGAAGVLVSNHASYLDPLPLIAALPLRYAFVAKSEAAGWPVVGTFLRGMGHLTVERDEAKESVAATELLTRALHEGRSLLFFPEGTFTRATGLRPFKLGAFKLAAESGRPLVPVALVGTRRWLRDGSWIPRRSELEVVVGSPLYARTTALADVVRLRDEAAEAMALHVGEPRLDLVMAGPLKKAPRTREKDS